MMDPRITLVLIAADIIIRLLEKESPTGERSELAKIIGALRQDEPALHSVLSAAARRSGRMDEDPDDERDREELQLLRKFRRLIISDKLRRPEQAPEQGGDDDAV